MREGFSGARPHQQPGRPELNPALKEAHQRAIRLLQEDAIDPRSFDDLYGKEVIERDAANVRALKAKFERDETDPAAHQLAQIFEAIVLEQSELSNWLGQDAQTIRTAEFDDFKNGVDMIVEFDGAHQSPQHLALAVDVTFGTAALKKKFQRIRDEIDADQLGHIKYFRSEQNGYRGELSQLPRGIIGLESDSVAQLAGLWLHGHKTQLAEHEVQRIIAEEIDLQMRILLAYAKRKKSMRAIQAYERAARVSGRILDQKRKIPFNDLDRVYRGIHDELMGF